MYYLETDGSLWEETNGVLDLQRDETVVDGTVETGCSDGLHGPLTSAEGPWCAGGPGTSDADCRDRYGPDAWRDELGNCGVPVTRTICPEFYTADTRNGETVCVLVADTQHIAAPGEQNDAVPHYYFELDGTIWEETNQKGGLQREDIVAAPEQEDCPGNSQPGPGYCYFLWWTSTDDGFCQHMMDNPDAYSHGNECRFDVEAGPCPDGYTRVEDDDAVTCVIFADEQVTIA